MCPSSNSSSHSSVLQHLPHVAGEQFARACHPRLQLEHVTQGCPRPMTWVWFDSNSTQKKRGGASKQGQDAAGATQSHELVLYFLHGGGYWLFTGKSHIEYVARLVKVMGSQGISIKACVIDHRRAPEHPWPVPILAPSLRQPLSNTLLRCLDMKGMKFEIGYLQSLFFHGQLVIACVVSSSAFRMISRN